MFGEATKFSSLLLDAAKEYEATLLLGVSTSTGDVTGEVLERRPVSLKESDIQAVVASFLGERLQMPPMHSALKHHGVPLYELARRGEVVEREPRRIVIEELVVTRLEGAECDFRVRCSKGTYIRVLGEDIGRALGCGATLGALRRTLVASFSVRDSLSSQQLEAQDADELVSHLMPIDAGLDHLPSVQFDFATVERLRLGQSVQHAPNASQDPARVRVYDADSKSFVGLGRWVDEWVHPVRLVIPRTAKIA